ncbi:pneumolysin [Streptococcus pneumoniae]|nr:pneumolysin [Streptococcus pneumoniae]VKG45386.1 pneumolysin [Streptococcus pneumoniae]VMY53462.1 pneumolysin [Streptococcus pneumoniae]VNN65371.1 pneumolysin [Streptococcus pneumoniae]VNZ68175.1 pneumolysin [Streptococcus pneumoniae]
MFQDTVTVEDLKQRGISAERPLVYISSVAYGRQVYLKLETTSKSDEVEAAFEALIKGVKVAPQTEWKQILDNTEVKAVILGGDPSSGARVVTGKVDMVEDLIQEGSRFTADHPGLPISYTTSFLRDNVVATFQNSTDYVETKVTAYRNGDLLLDHSGAYVAQYYITWNELSYDHQGKEVLTPKAWDRNGQDLTAHFTTSIPLKGNVRNLSVKIRECTGLAWEWWRTVYEKTDLPLVRKRTISIWGTTLYPQVEDKVEND